MLKRMSIVITTMFGIPLSLFAARPFVTDDAGTVEQSRFELESASDYWKELAFFGVTLKHGLTSHMDLGVSFGYQVIPQELRAAQPMELSLKYNFIPEHFSTSFTGAFNSSTYAVNAIYTHSFNILLLNANAGFEATESIREMALTYGLAAVINAGIAAVGAEIGGKDKRMSWWQIGTQINLLEWLAFDLGLGGDFEKNIGLTATSGIWFSF